MNVHAAAHDWVLGRVRAGEITPGTGRHYRDRLGLFLAACGADLSTCEVDVRHVHKWRNQVGGHRPATRRAYDSTVRAFLTHLVDTGQLGTNPLENLPRPRVPRHPPRNLSRAQVTAAADHMGERTLVGWLLMLQCGLRRGEVVAIEMADVDLHARTIRVRGKGGHERVVPVPDEAHEAVVAYAHHSGPLLRSHTERGAGICGFTLYADIRRALQDSGVKLAAWDGVSPHAARHTAATDVLAGGASVRDVQRLLGHADLSTTAGYLDVVIGDLADVVAGRRYVM